MLTVVGQEILQADALERTLDAEAADAGQIADERQRVQAELHGVQAEIDRLVTALASGVAFDAISAGLKEREQAKQALQARVEHLDGRAKAAPVDRAALRATVKDWREKLSQSPRVAHQVLARVLSERLRFQPDGAFAGRASFGHILTLGMGPDQASPEAARWTVSKSQTDGRPSVTPRA